MQSVGVHDPYQEGFTKGKNTIQYLNRLNTTSKAGVEHNNCVIGIFIDFEKIFDSIWLEGLMVKLFNAGVKGNVLSLINSFVFTNEMKLYINDHVGNTRQSQRYGLPQGSCLSPVLFKFYLNDLCTDLPVNAGFQLFKFADDRSILCCSSSTEICFEMMNHSVNSLKQCCSKWRMVVNCSKNKTEFICFNTPRSSSTLIPSQIKFGNKTIQNMNETKVLGVIFDNRLKFISHSEMIYNRLCSRWVNICKYANKNWGLCQRTLVFLVKTILLPCIFYGGIIWMSEKNTKKLTNCCTE